MRRDAVRQAVLLLAVVFGLWTLRAAWMLIMVRDSPDVPSARALPDLPRGARQVGLEKQCGSGGCWLELSVEPAPGQSVDQLARAMGAATESCHWGDLIDPRRTCVGREPPPDRGVLRVYAAHWSRA